MDMIEPTESGIFPGNEESEVARIPKNEISSRGASMMVQL